MVSRISSDCTKGYCFHISLFIPYLPQTYGPEEVVPNSMDFVFFLHGRYPFLFLFLVILLYEIVSMLPRHMWTRDSDVRTTFVVTIYDTACPVPNGNSRIHGLDISYHKRADCTHPYRALSSFTVTSAFPFLLTFF